MLEKGQYPRVDNNKGKERAKQQSLQLQVWKEKTPTNGK